jgi:hypothetical protein
MPLSDQISAQAAEPHAASLKTVAPATPQPPEDSTRLEAVTVSVGFDDLLDVTLGLNHGQVDTMIVVTSHDDKATQDVAKKHSAMCVQTDLFFKNGRTMNKGAAINAGFNFFQYRGWRMHLDADMILPGNFRRVLFNHTHLAPDTIYGADRVDIVGPDELKLYLATLMPQQAHGLIVKPWDGRPIGSRIVSTLQGYLPLGFFQLWHHACQHPYPYSLGTAAHDDIMFSALWPQSQRVHLATVILYHLTANEPAWGQNWEGRQQPRFMR